ncbi:MAG TPA: hypothetical protein VNI84_08685 [Pyrinomonadaceae bacterium]|nr:hypothetical protein [Pyrinomonadaceae bacterium]
MGKRYSSKQSLFAFGPRQTNFQTEAANAVNNWRFLVKEGYAKASFDSPNVNNAGESTGLALPDKTYKDKDTSGFSAVEQLTFQLLGIRANDAFGVTATPVVVVAGATGAPPLVIRHRFSLLDPFTSAALPARALASKVAEPAVASNEIYNARFPSMTYNRFTISDSGDKPNLTLDSEWVGSGQMTEPSGIQFYGTGKHVLGTATGEINETPINKRSGVTTIYPQAGYLGTAILTNCLSRGVTNTINENLNTDGGYAGCALFQDGDPRKGAIAGSLDSTGQTVAYEITLVADSDILQGFKVNQRLKAGTEFSMKTAYTGPVISGAETHKATFGLSRAVIASAEWVDLEGGTQGIRIVTEPLANGNFSPFDLELISNVADFNTYVGA